MVGRKSKNSFGQGGGRGHTCLKTSQGFGCDSKGPGRQWGGSHEEGMIRWALLVGHGFCFVQNNG